MDVVFASSKGAQYRYFKCLSNDLGLDTSLVTLRPVFFPSFFGSGLTCNTICEGIAFHVERKKRKYFNYHFPAIFWALYRLRSSYKFIKIFLRFSRYFNIHKPKVVGLWNGHRLPEMAIKAAAKYRGVDVLYFENGLLPSTTTADFSGVNALNSVPRDLEFYMNYQSENKIISYERNELEVRKAHKSKRHLSGTIKDNNIEYIFIPFQVDFDSQVVLNSPWVNSMEEFWVLLTSVISKINDKNLCFVIKEHPSDPRVYTEYHNQNERILFSSDSTEYLIRNAKAVITLNSSVGLETLMLEKKLIVLGDACFKVQDITMCSDSESELINALNGLESWEPNLIALRSFINYLYDEYCILIAWQTLQESMDEVHLHALEKRIKQHFLK
ncbi:MAG: capsular polysaccharide export protein [Oceanicoccus sp.]|jgi:capsular polysaccharide export protein